MKNKILSGMRPSGKLHIGHLEGVLNEWVKLQENNNCFYFVADWHALTTNSNTKEIKQDSIDMVKDWIAYGIDPNKSTIFIQSQIPEHAELNLALGMLVNIGTLERVPSFKEYVKQIKNTKNISEKELNKIARANINYGFLGYPILQSADILLYKPNIIPVGQDQLPHIELTRNIAQKFNSIYGDIFTLPEPKLGKTPKILGFDGRKMSKSYNNSIEPTESKEDIEIKVKKMITDPNKIKLKDPGNPYICSVYDLQEIFNDNHKEISKECLSGDKGCVNCKKELSQKIYNKYEEFNEKRNKITNDFATEILYKGTRKAQKIAKETMQEVKEFMLIDYFTK